MNKLLKNTLGVISDGDNWIEVLLEDNAPKKSIGGIGRQYVYVTKYDRAGRVENHSIGLPADKAVELGKILLTAANDDAHDALLTEQNITSTASIASSIAIFKK